MTTNEPNLAVDTAQILLIDPSYLPDEAQAVVADYVRRRLAVLIGTCADGGYRVEVDDDNNRLVVHGTTHSNFYRADEYVVPC